MLALISRRSFIAFCLGLLALGGSILRASPVAVDLEASLFGSLTQGDTNWPNMGCGPTSATNSFTYLQNRYPGTYDYRLVSEAAHDTANALGVLMGTTNTTGTYLSNFISGKQQYIEQQRPGVTTYGAQMAGGWNAGVGPKPGYVTDNSSPTPGWIMDQLNNGADVEMLMNFASPSFGHFVTITGITYDSNLNEGEIRFIDPLDGQQHHVGFVTPVTGQETITVLSYTEPNGTEHGLGTVTGAVSENAVPEPSVVLVALVPVMVALVRRRRVCVDEGWR